jgi:hypothetical protein
MPPTNLHPQSNVKRGVKRDMSLFPTLNKEEGWTKWDESLCAIASAQGVEDIIDSNKILTPSDMDLDNEKQKFMFAVFQRCVQTDIGKAIVRKHKSQNDARNIYKELCDHALTSTAAEHKGAAFSRISLLLV